MPSHFCIFKHLLRGIFLKDAYQSSGLAPSSNPVVSMPFKVSGVELDLCLYLAQLHNSSLLNSNTNLIKPNF